MVRRGAWLIAAFLLLVAFGSARAVAQSDDPAALQGRVTDLYRAGKFAEAMEAAEQVLALVERRHGRDSIEVANPLSMLAVLYLQQGRYREAEPLYERTLAIKQKALGPDHNEVGTTLYGLATLYVQQGRYGEAEPLYKRTLVIKEKALGPDHSDVGSTLFGLAALYVYLGRLEEAEPLYRRSIAVKEQALGPQHTEVGSVLHNLGVLLYLQRRYQEAEPIYRRVLAIKEAALGPDHTEVGSALYGLAQLYAAQGLHREAEPVYRRVLAIKERTLGAEHTEVATTLFGLAGLYSDQGRDADAEPLLQRVLEIKLKALGPDHPEVGTTLDELAAIRFRLNRWAEAVDYWRPSAQVVIRRTSRGAETTDHGASGTTASEAQRERARFEGLIKAAHRLAVQNTPLAEELAREMFTMAQWSQDSQAALSLAQMAARQAKGSGALAQLVRERQDLVEDWQVKDQSLIAARSQPPERRNAQSEDALATRLAEIDARLAVIDAKLAKDFPEYAIMVSPQPLTLDEVQELLRDDEALLLLFDTRDRQPAPEETFIWVVTRGGARWLVSGMGTKALTEHVAALRCGLDQAAWDGEGQARCAGLIGRAPRRTATGQVLPFDLGRAHDLYRALFGQAEDLIKGKHLLIAPSGPLTAIPFQALTTERPAVAFPSDDAGYANAAWFARRNAITVLPSVASLRALRQFAKTSKATQAFIGFGNPLLAGPSGTDRQAWEQQTCPGVARRFTRAVSRRVRGTISRFFRGNLADVDAVRNQAPLPETVDELCAVARSVGSPRTAVHLGGQASETAVKALSAAGTLADARVVHFATHGLLASETNRIGASRAEPALILTPPDNPTEADDGLLTASEVAQLRLDADWVVLSACNTAAGESDGVNSEALSGLARAFFYAGARALLVSHWSVDSEATVSLVTKAFDTLRRDPGAGRAESLRRSMLSMIASGGRNAHPATWAPFVVVGADAR
jgi:CHAT domain-containing protein/tetratricopeptide (TPR) repeat protein